MQDCQKQLEQMVKKQTEEFRQRLWMMQRRHQTIVAQLAMEQRAQDWNRLCQAVKQFQLILLSRVEEVAIRMLATPRMSQINQPTSTQHSELIDAVYTVSDAGVIEQMELPLDKEISHE